MQTPHWLNYLVAYLTLTGGIYAAFNASEGLLRQESKRRIGAWLGQPDGSRRLFDKRWTTSVIEFFDVLLVPEERREWRFPFPCFMRSSLFSIVFCTFILVLFYIFSENVRNSILHEIEKTGFKNFLYFFMLMVPCSIIPDYIANAETRIMLLLMKKSRAPLFFLILDAGITFSIPFFAFEFLDSVNKDGVSYFDFNVYADIIFMQIGSGFSPGFAAYFYSTFLTSMWIWLYTIGSSIFIVSGWSDGFRLFLDRHTVLEEKPLSVIGWFLIATMTVIFWSYIAITSLISGTP